MLTTEGECSTGASMGPICSSIRRVSPNGSASGISSQRSRGSPMSTVKARSDTRVAVSRPASVSSTSVSPCGRAMPGSSIMAQATQRVPLPQAADVEPSVL